MSVNYIDILIILFVAGYAVNGYFRGAIKSGLELLFMVLSLIFAFLIYKSIASGIYNLFKIPPNLLKVIAFILAWSIAELILNIISELLYKEVPQEVKDQQWNKWTGTIPSALRGIFITAIVLLFSVSLPLSGNVKTAVETSFLGKPLLSISSGVEGAIARVFDDAISEAFTLLTIKPDSEESVNLGYSTDEYSIDYGAEQNMLRFVNDERRKRGLAELSWDENIARVARAHSADMFSRGYFAHENPDGLSPFDRMEAGKIKFLVAGENLALAPTVDLAHKGLMESPGHRENILRPEFGRVGIGVQDGGIYGRMFTQNFAD